MSRPKLKSVNEIDMSSCTGCYFNAPECCTNDNDIMTEDCHWRHIIYVPATDNITEHKTNRRIAMVDKSESIPMNAKVSIKSPLYHLHRNTHIDLYLDILDCESSELGSVADLADKNRTFTVCSKTLSIDKEEGLVYLIKDDYDYFYVISECGINKPIPDATSRGVALILKCPHCRCTNYVEERDSENNTECNVCSETFHIPDDMPT
jgi:hypothetical protein